MPHAGVSVHPGTNTTNVSGDCDASAASSAVCITSYMASMTDPTKGGFTW